MRNSVFVVVFVVFISFIVSIKSDVIRREKPMDIPSVSFLQSKAKTISLEETTDGYGENADDQSYDESDSFVQNQTLVPNLPSYKSTRLDGGSIVLGFFTGVSIVFVLWLIINWQIFYYIYEEIMKYIDGRAVDEPYYSASARGENGEMDSDDLIVRGAEF